MDFRRLLIDALKGDEAANQRLFNHLYAEMLSAPEARASEEYLAYMSQVFSDALQLLVDPEAFLLGRETGAYGVRFWFEEPCSTNNGNDATSGLTMDELLTRRCVMRVFLRTPLTDEDVEVLRGRYGETVMGMTTGTPLPMCQGSTAPGVEVAGERFCLLSG